MGNFATIGAATKLSSDDRFRASSTSGGSASMQFDRPTQMQRTASQGGPGATPLGNNRTRSKRGEKRNDGNKVGGGGGGQQGHTSGFNNSAPSRLMGQGKAPLEAIAPLRQSANRWDRKTIGTVDPDSPEIVGRKVKGLLNKLMMEKFNSMTRSSLGRTSRRRRRMGGHSSRLSGSYLRRRLTRPLGPRCTLVFCRKMMEQISQTGVPEAPPMQTAYSPTSLKADCGRTFLCSYHRLHNVIPECILIPASHILFLHIIFNLHSFVFRSHVCYYVLCSIAIYVHSHR